MCESFCDSDTGSDASDVYEYDPLNVAICMEEPKLRRASAVTNLRRSLLARRKSLKATILQLPASQTTAQLEDFDYSFNGSFTRMEEFANISARLCGPEMSDVNNHVHRIKDNESYESLDSFVKTKTLLFSKDIENVLERNIF